MRLGNPTSGERVLVILPTYHSCVEWIDRAVRSVVSQTHENINCMIVKDGCRQEGHEECSICKETSLYCRSIRDRRFSFYSLPGNCGAAGWGPRNFALSNSRHQLICYLDDDNWYDADHVSSLFEALNASKSDMAYTGTRLWDSNMNVVGDRIHAHRPEQGQIDTSEIMHRRMLVDLYGGWRKVAKCNDWDIVSRWREVSWSHTGKITLNFFIREGCGTHRL